MDSNSELDFGFAFNNVNFSDRILRIEITNVGEITNVDRDSVRDSKRMRKDVNTHGVEDENHSYLGMTTNPPTPRVKELHISSPILAARSPFFHKLFSNGMIESKQKHLTLRIDSSEEAAVMELLNFMYTNSLSVTEFPALLRVLLAADKFDVVSCMNYCTHWLLKMPMTLEYASLILHLPSTVLMSDSVKPLTNAARQYFPTYYKDITRFSFEELMALPLVGIEALLMSNDLVIPSEDMVYEIVSNWVKTHYLVLEERQEILSHLARYIRFSHMTCPRLKKILTSDDFKPSVARNLVLEALFFKAEPMPQKAAMKSDSLENRFVERAYIYRPIKVVEFEVPHRQCIVYLDLTRKECDALIHPPYQIHSQMFHLGGHMFLLTACCVKRNGFDSFGLLLGTHEKGPMNLTVDFQFSARWKPSEEFAIRYKRRYKFFGFEVAGCLDLFGTSWDRFIAEDGPYFINDILHLRAELSIRL